MSEKRYVVRLTEDERSMLTALVKSEKRVAARKRRRAQVLLKIDGGEHGPGWTDKRAASAFDLHVNSVKAIREQLVELGLEAALARKKQEQPSRRPKLDDAGERQLVTIARGEAPGGRARWTLQLLADRLVELKVVDSICRETVRKGLKKTRSNLTSKPHG